MYQGGGVIGVHMRLQNMAETESFRLQRVEARWDVCSEKKGYCLLSAIMMVLRKMHGERIDVSMKEDCELSDGRYASCGQADAAVAGVAAYPKPQVERQVEHVDDQHADTHWDLRAGQAEHK